MIVFNPNWGTNRRIQIEAPSYPLQGLECAVKPEGKVFSVVHGYDRCWDVKSLFEFRYRFGGTFDLAAYKLWNAELAALQPSARRGLRSPKREKLTGTALVQVAGRSFKRN
jgi:hypothetical protein